MSWPPPGRCAKCFAAHDEAELFAPRPEWGYVIRPLCVRCWSAYAVAREAGSFVDWYDAFDNATDEQLAAYPFPEEDIPG